MKNWLRNDDFSIKLVNSRGVQLSQKLLLLNKVESYSIDLSPEYSGRFSLDD